MGWQHGKKLEIKPTAGRFLPNTSSWVSSDRERGLMVHHCCHVVDALQCSAVGARLRTFSRAARVFAYKSGPSYKCRVDKPLWPRAHPLLRDLTSVPAARATMSWHGQADDAARSERVCRCSRRSRTFTLEQRAWVPRVRLQLCGRSRCSQAALRGHAASPSGRHCGMVVWSVPVRLGCMLPALVLWGVSWLA